MSETLERCPLRHPGTKSQCGMWKGHDGEHTVLIPTNMPWSGVNREAPSADATAGEASPQPLSADHECEWCDECRAADDANTVLQVLARTFDDADEAMEEWRAWYKPEQWLGFSRGLGVFIRKRFESRASSAPTEAQCAECARLRDGLADLEHDFVMAPDGDGNRVRCIYWSDVEELLAGDRAP